MLECPLAVQVASLFPKFYRHGLQVKPVAHLLQIFFVILFHSLDILLNLETPLVWLQDAYHRAT